MAISSIELISDTRRSLKEQLGSHHGIEVRTQERELLGWIKYDVFNRRRITLRFGSADNNDSSDTTEHVSVELYESLSRGFTVSDIEARYVADELAKIPSYALIEYSVAQDWYRLRWLTLKVTDPVLWAKIYQSPDFTEA